MGNVSKFMQSACKQSAVCGRRFTYEERRDEGRPDEDLSGHDPQALLKLKHDISFSDNNNDVKETTFADTHWLKLYQGT